ncbi:hypothetical protein C8R43DRAFT_997157 [Mycena crocata]|nr:hypothetical protein C8R43DRAFT_997157 [Mycena crocata]
MSCPLALSLVFAVHVIAMTPSLLVYVCLLLSSRSHFSNATTDNDHPSRPRSAQYHVLHSDPGARRRTEGVWMRCRDFAVERAVLTTELEEQIVLSETRQLRADTETAL